jgi:hypothetical protein
MGEICSVVAVVVPAFVSFLFAYSTLSSTSTTKTGKEIFF